MKTAASAPSAIFYDLDGTLIDSAPSIAAALEMAVQSVLPDAVLPPLRPFIGPPLPQILENLLPDTSPAQRAAIAAQFRPLYDNQFCRDCQLFPGVRETLKALHAAQIPAFVVTNKPRIPTLSVVFHLEIAPFFAAFLSPDSRPDFSSKTAMVSYLIAQYDLDPTCCLLVGDSRDDWEAARAHAMPFAAAAYGYSGAHQLPNQLTLARFADLGALIFEAAPTK